MPVEDVLPKAITTRVLALCAKCVPKKPIPEPQAVPTNSLSLQIKHKRVLSVESTETDPPKCCRVKQEEFESFDLLTHAETLNSNVATSLYCTILDLQMEFNTFAKCTRRIIDASTTDLHYRNTNLGAKGKGKERSHN